MTLKRSKKFKANNSKPSKCLSSSILWEHLQDYYNKIGPLAWQDDLVPYQITSNKLLAHLYTTLINGIMCDPAGSIDPKEPCYILELGVGHGKFSFYIIKFLEFFALHSHLKFNIIYIASDISQQNIDSWQKHPQLQEYIKNQQLDFAKFDAENDQNIYLINSKKTINKNSLVNPLFVIANYVFDTLTHDAFRCKDNQLFVSTIDVYNKEKEKEKEKNSFSFKNFKYKYHHHPIENNYYKQEVYNQILINYQNELTDGSFLFPIGSLRSIENIKTFSQKNTIFFVADKGNINIKDFFNMDDPSIAEHGSISFMVNFHALEKFFLLTNGSSIVMPNTYTDLQIALFQTNKNYQSQFLNIIAKHILYDINPQYLINLCYTNDSINKFKNLDQLLAVLILSKWDPDLFYDLSDQMLLFINRAIKKDSFNLEQEQTIINGLNIVWDYFFKLAKEQDLPFVLANIYYDLEEYTLALKFFKISLKEFGEAAETWYNIALCYFAVDDYKLAKKSAKKTLELNSKYSAAKKLLLELTEEVC